MQNGYTAMDITKSHAMHHSLRALLAAGLITPKIGRVHRCTRRLIPYSMLEAFIAIGLSEALISRRRNTTNCLQQCWH